METREDATGWLVGSEIATEAGPVLGANADNDKLADGRNRLARDGIVNRHQEVVWR
jgi:hypothetical protein